MRASAEALGTFNLNCKHMKKTSYKEMLRDRISDMQAVDLALKWCKAKTRWINHTYDNFINCLADKSERYEATRIILGISGKCRNFDFHKTIMWENLSEDDTEYWKIVEGWVIWFQNNMLEIEYDVQHGATISQLNAKYAKGLSDPTALSIYLIANSW